MADPTRDEYASTPMAVERGQTPTAGPSTDDTTNAPAQTRSSSGRGGVRAAVTPSQPRGRTRSGRVHKRTTRGAPRGQDQSVGEERDATVADDAAEESAGRELTVREPTAQEPITFDMGWKILHLGETVVERVMPDQEDDDLRRLWAGFCTWMQRWLLGDQNEDRLVADKVTWKVTFDNGGGTGPASAASISGSSTRGPLMDARGVLDMWHRAGKPGLRVELDLHVKAPAGGPEREPVRPATPQARRPRARGVERGPGYGGAFARVGHYAPGNHWPAYPAAMTGWDSQVRMGLAPIMPPSPYMAYLMMMKERYRERIGGYGGAVGHQGRVLMPLAQWPWYGPVFNGGFPNVG